jgi:hypothetical protein
MAPPRRARPSTGRAPSRTAAPGLLRAEHLRRRPLEARSGALHCFLLDCSASMRNDGNLARAKGMLLSLMEEAYQRRDHVALLCFAGDVVEAAPARRAARARGTTTGWRPSPPVAARRSRSASSAPTNCLPAQRGTPALALAADRWPQHREPRAARSGRFRLRGRLRSGAHAAAPGAAAGRKPMAGALPRRPERSQCNPTAHRVNRSAPDRIG